MGVELNCPSEIFLEQGHFIKISGFIFIEVI